LSGIDETERRECATAASDTAKEVLAATYKAGEIMESGIITVKNTAIARRSSRE